MPDAVNVQARAIQLRQVLQGQGITPQRIGDILTRAARELGDQFVTDGTLDQAIVGLNPELQQSIRGVAQRLFPPAPFPLGIRLGDVNNARILHGGAAPDRVDHDWAWGMVGLRGANFNVGNYNPLGLVANTLAQEGAWGAPAGIQGAALARGFWRDNFFSSMEFASVFHYMQTLPPAQRQEFQAGFFNEMVNQTNQRSNVPGNPAQSQHNQRYMTMQFLRFAANTNWNNPNTPPEFREFTRNFGDALVNNLPAYQGLANQVRADGRPRVAQTYDLDGERHTYGGAFMYLYRGEDGQVRSGVFRHIPPQNPNNLLNLNFPPAPMAMPAPGGAFPGFPPQPGWGNFPAWPAQPQLPPGAPGPVFPPAGGAGMWPPAPGVAMPPAPAGWPPAPGGLGPIWPFPGVPGGVPGWVPPAAPAAVAPVAPPEIRPITLPALSRNGGNLPTVAGMGGQFTFRIGTDVNAPALRPGETDPRTGISIDAMGGYRMPAGVPLGTRVSILDAQGRIVGVTSVENAIANAGNRNGSIAPGGNERIDFGGPPPPFQVRINDGALVDPSNTARSGVTVRPNGQIDVAAGAPVGTRITIRTQGGQEITRVVEPNINTTGLAGGAADLDSRLEVPAAVNLRVRLLGDPNPPRNLTNEWQDLGNGIRVRRGPDGEVQFNRGPGAPDMGVIPLEFITEGGQSAVVQYDAQPPAVADQRISTAGDLTGRLTLPLGTQITGIRLERTVFGGAEEPDFTEVHLGNTEFSPLNHAATNFRISEGGHFDTSGMAENAAFVLRLSDGREVRVTTNNPIVPMF